MRKLPFLLSVLILVSSCGGRVSHPVAETTTHDQQLSCEHLQAEQDINKEKIADLLKEKDRQCSMRLERFQQ